VRGPAGLEQVDRGRAGARGEHGHLERGVADLVVAVVEPLAPRERGVLEAHMKGEQAAKVAAMDPDAQIAFVLENLEKVQPGIGKYVEGGTSYAWGDDPWAGGGYAWWKPGELTAWLPELAKAEGRIHFAGDQTSPLARTVEGALQSGVRAAGEVSKA